MTDPEPPHRRQPRPAIRRWPVLAAVLFVLVLAAGARLAGVQPWSVISGSMDPAVPKGAVVLTIRDLDPVPGRVYLYEHPGFDEPVLHRYLGPAGDGTLVFQGDANPVPDQPVRPGQLTGRMVAVVPLPGALEDILAGAALDHGGVVATAGYPAAGIAALAGAGTLAARRRTGLAPGPTPRA